MSKSSHFFGQPIYGQLIKSLDREKIVRISREHGGERYVKSFDGFTHLLTMLYAVTMRFDSLREIEASMMAEVRKLHHVGIDTVPKRSTLSDANVRRSEKFFEKNLQKSQQQKLLEQEREIEQTRIRQQKEKEKKLELERQRKEQDQLRKQKEAKNTPSPKQNLVLLGVELTDEQQETLMNGGHTFLENLTSNDGKTQFSAYSFLNDEKNTVYFTSESPDTFVKYGKYEMRLRDKALIEDGQITKAAVKWWGSGSYAHPYL